MRRILLAILIGLVSTSFVCAQVPYFSETPGHNTLYGYTSIKFKPGINSIESYTAFQYGITKFFAAGLDLYTNTGNAYSGFLVRGGYKFNKWIGIGLQFTPSFDLSDNFKFSYLTSALYLNGNITRNGKFFWVSNTWYTANSGAKDTWFNWEYIGMNIPVGRGHSINPMVGMIHSWKFDQDADLAAGLYYSIKSWNFYLWGDSFLKDHPRVVLGIDFKLGK